MKTTITVTLSESTNPIPLSLSALTEGVTLHYCMGDKVRMECNTVMDVTAVGTKGNKSLLTKTARVTPSKQHAVLFTVDGMACAMTVGKQVEDNVYELHVGAIATAKAVRKARGYMDADALKSLNARIDQAAVRHLLLSYVRDRVAGKSESKWFFAPRVGIESGVDTDVLAAAPFDTIVVGELTDEPDHANRYQFGTFAERCLREELMDLTKTAEFVEANGTIKEGAHYWPMVSVAFGDLIKTAKRLMNKAKKAAKKAGDDSIRFNPNKPLKATSNVGQLWKALKEGDVTLNWDGTEYRFLAQSAGDGKIAKARFWAIDARLWEKADAFLKAGMDFTMLEEGKKDNEGKVIKKGKGYIKPTYYMALGFTGLDVIVPQDLMDKLWAHTVVVKDYEFTESHNVLCVKGPNDQVVESRDFKHNQSDGAGYAFSEGIKILHMAGLRADASIAQCRAEGFVKGMIFGVPDSFRPTGKGEDFWGNEFDWTNVWMVLTESMFKACMAYKDMATYLSMKPIFGFKQPSYRVRQLNGQIADALGLSQEERDTLSVNSLETYTRKVASADVVNVPALAGALRSMAMTGFTSEQFASMEQGDVIDMIHKKFHDSEHSWVRGINTAHWDVEGRNAYLMPDALAFFTHGQQKLLRKKGDHYTDKHGVERVQQYDQVCIPSMPKGLVVVCRNPMACGNEVAVVFNKHIAGVPEGVCMLPAGSKLCNILSGADFDGDQVLVSAWEELVKIAMSKDTTKEFWFETPQAQINAWWEASFGEMQNSLFQSSSQNASRVMNGNFDHKEKAMLSRFFSAMMQVAVDAGKYGYVLPGEWLKFADKFAHENHQLPGWKWSKGEKGRGLNRALVQVMDAVMLEGKDESDPDFWETVYAKLEGDYDVTAIQLDADNWAVKANDELVDTVDVNGVVHTNATMFASKHIVPFFGVIAEVYESFWMAYGRLDEDEDQ